MKKRSSWNFISSCSLLAVLGSAAMALSFNVHAATDVGPNVVNVVAKEFQFDMPDTIPAGPTLFRLSNEGHQLHHVTLVKLEQGKTVADFTAAMAGPPPAWAVFVGGPNTPTPQHGQVEDVVDLAPGNYAVICIIPDADGKPHMMKGMTKALTVTPATKVGAMPQSDVTLTLDDYKFAFSTPITPGKHALHIVNHAKQMHEAVMFRLEPGKTGEDIAHWVESGMQGPPPAAPVAGISPMGSDKDNTLLVDLSAGNYALLCFVPDAHDGKPHMAHGMIYNFKV